MMDVLRLLVMPTECQHVLMERYFEKPDSSLVKEKCGDFCSRCKMDTSSSTGRIHRDKLCCFLITFATGCTRTTSALIKSIKSKKDEIYHKDDVPNKMMGPIHALCLQLVAKSIIELAIADDKRNLIGKTDLSPLNVIVRLVINGNDPAVMNDTAWEGFNLVTCN